MYYWFYFSLFERFKLEEEQKNATRLEEPKEINQEYLMKRAIDQAMTFRARCSLTFHKKNVERLQSPCLKLH